MRWLGGLCLVVVSVAVASPALPAPVNAQDAKLKAIYTADEAWRRAQRGAGDPDKPDKILPELPFVDAEHMQLRMEHNQAVMRQLDGLAPKTMSADELVNYEVFRAQVVDRIEDLRFKEYEKPANSDSTFWSNEELGMNKPFRTADDYRKFIAQMGDMNLR